MKSNPIIFLIIIIYYLPWLSIANEHHINIYYHERLPYYKMKNNKLIGIVGNRAQQILDKSGITYRILNIPAARQIDEVKSNEEHICAIGWFKNEEREIFAKFSMPIYQDKPAVLITTKDQTDILKTKKIDELLANKSLYIGLKLGYSYGEFIDKKISQHKPNELHTSKGNFGMMEMLKAKRFDYFIVAEEEAEELISPTNSHFIIHRLSDLPPGSHRYFMCSKKVDNSIIHKINQATKSLSF
ncbi:substrate-binding periplasmic protein [Spartinivicinus ruber]|uniref:substrate-binding periplasmic protein n=1 Tax=Spartinivicinus ruber TaxID=2683272 RepID=UPI0013CF8712|nr:transporter substrate-binding domain-containing protein [Spartinivicinus ruber]